MKRKMVKPTNSDHANTLFLKPSEIRYYLTRAQKGEQQAIDVLCEAFKPLIFKEIRVMSVYNVLKEDAENIAWEIFLKFIFNYKGNNYRLLPGLIQKRLHYGLIDAMHQEGGLYDCENLDATACETQLVDDKAHINKCVDRVAVKEALNNLSPRGKDLLLALYFDDMSLGEYAQQRNLSRSTCYSYQERAFACLRKYL